MTPRAKKDEIRELRFHVTYRIITAQARPQMNSAALQRVVTTKTASSYLLRKMKEDGGVQGGEEEERRKLKGWPLNSKQTACMKDRKDSALSNPLTHTQWTTAPEIKFLHLFLPAQLVRKCGSQDEEERFDIFSLSRQRSHAQDPAVEFWILPANACALGFDKGRRCKQAKDKFSRFDWQRSRDRKCEVKVQIQLSTYVLGCLLFQVRTQRTPCGFGRGEREGN